MCHMPQRLSNSKSAFTSRTQPKIHQHNADKNFPMRHLFDPSTTWHEAWNASAWWPIHVKQSLVLSNQQNCNCGLLVCKEKPVANRMTDQQVNQSTGCTRNVLRNEDMAVHVISAWLLFRALLSTKKTSCFFVRVPLATWWWWSGNYRAIADCEILRQLGGEGNVHDRGTD